MFMGHRWYYDFDNFEDIYVCLPAVRHGTCFEFMGCLVKFYTLHDYEILFEVKDSSLSKNDAEKVFEQATKLLSVLFALPLYEENIYRGQVHDQLDTNKLLSKKKRDELKYIEKRVSAFKKVRTFWNDMIDLTVVAYGNLYRYREEDAFVYFFKVIERIAKEYYITYMQRHHTKAATSNNKNVLRNFLDTYAANQLGVKMTPDMLDRKVDLFYKEFKMEFYGSVFNKISLFVNREKISVDVQQISKMVKVRNKLAHGDKVEKEELDRIVGASEYLALQMFSKYFFRKKYEEIHLKSYRYEYGKEVF